MINLFKFISKYWKTVIVITAILFVQAFCDLSLPTYTSDIVNVGIQQKGVKEKIPFSISAKEMDRVKLLSSEDEISKIEKNYTKDGDKYLLNEEIKENKDSQEALYKDMKIPMMMVNSLESENKEVREMEKKIKSGFPKGALPENADMFDILKVMPKNQKEKMIEGMTAKIDKIPDSIVDQQSVNYVSKIYKKQGVDLNKKQTGYVWNTGIKMTGLAFLSMISSVVVALLASRIGASTGRDLRSRVFEKVVSFSNNEFDHFSTASLITRSTNDIQQIQLITVMMLRIILYSPILAIGGIYKVFNTNVSMSWIIALSIGCIAFVIAILFIVVIPKFKVLQKLVDRVNLVTREILTGLSVIRAFSTREYEEKRFDRANTDLTKLNLFVNRAMTFMMPLMFLIMNATSVLILWEGSHGISDGAMQVGDMMAFIQYTMQIIMSFLMLCMLSVMLPRAGVAADRISEILNSQSIVLDPEKPVKFSGKNRGVVKFENVSFRYPGADEDALYNISFEARPGETTAFIGSTGSGKSTLVNLIPRFYDVTEGSISLDGVDIREVTQNDLRDKIGYVPQKGVLFSGDIKSNIKFSDIDMDDERMVEAAEIAQATEFINQKEEGYESPISQGGSNVSGGQKQRLSIARAIAKKPDVFIFDDSFSALDYKTDVKLRNAIKDKISDSTVLIVAQRISTILHAEQIIVLDEGKIVGRGTHEELMKNCDVYKQIASSQLSASELEGGAV